MRERSIPVEDIDLPGNILNRSAGDTVRKTNLENCMDIVFDLWYVREYPDRDDTQLHIGIYRTHEDASAAVERLQDKPGFRDWPEGFHIHEVTLNRDGWTEGFVTA
jgi:hypothetical protein